MLSSSLSLCAAFATCACRFATEIFDSSSWALSSVAVTASFSSWTFLAMELVSSTFLSSRLSSIFFIMADRCDFSCAVASYFARKDSRFSVAALAASVWVFHSLAVMRRRRHRHNNQPAISPRINVSKSGSIISNNAQIMVIAPPILLHTVMNTCQRTYTVRF